MELSFSAAAVYFHVPWDAHCTPLKFTLLDHYSLVIHTLPKLNRKIGTTTY